MLFTEIDWSNCPKKPPKNQINTAFWWRLWTGTLVFHSWTLSHDATEVGICGRGCVYKPNPCRTKPRAVRQAAEVCSRMPLLGWPLRKPDFNRGRGQRGEVIHLIHTLNSTADGRPQECSERRAGFWGEESRFNEDLLVSAHCPSHRFGFIRSGLLMPGLLWDDPSHSPTHTHTPQRNSLSCLFSPGVWLLLSSSVQISTLLFDPLSLSSKAGVSHQLKAAHVNYGRHPWQDITQED